MKGTCGSMAETLKEELKSQEAKCASSGQSQGMIRGRQCQDDSGLDDSCFKAPYPE